MELNLILPLPLVELKEDYFYLCYDGAILLFFLKAYKRRLAKQALEANRALLFRPTRAWRDDRLKI